MKIQLFAAVTILAVILAVTLNSAALAYNIDRMIEAAEKIPEKTSAEEDYNALYEDFTRRQKYISLTVSHDDLTAIESDFAEIIGACRADDEESLIIAKSRLITELSHLRRLTGVNIDSIL